MYKAFRRAKIKKHTTRKNNSTSKDGITHFHQLCNGYLIVGDQLSFVFKVDFTLRFSLQKIRDIINMVLNVLNRIHTILRIQLHLKFIK